MCTVCACACVCVRARVTVYGRMCSPAHACLSIQRGKMRGVCCKMVCFDGVERQADGPDGCSFKTCCLSKVLGWSPDHTSTFMTNIK